MVEWLDGLLATQFMPHGHCYYWRPSLLWLHVVSDAGIGLAYFSIPVALFYFLRKRPGVDLGGVFVMFAAFIFLCGATHFVQILTVWQPYYYSEGIVKLATAGISGFTAVALWFLMPQALSLPTPGELQEANDRLQTENEERRRVEAELRELNEQLEAKVRQRTEELEQFIFAASHDLQEPLRQLGSYAGFLETDLGGNLPDRASEDVHFIREASDRMAQMVDSLLTLSRVGRQEIVASDVSLRECIDTALRNLEGIPHMHEARIGKIPDEIVHADATLLVGLYQNLVSNALKYADGEPEIEFTIERTDDEVILGVRDRGIGVASDATQRIFDPFVRLHAYNEVAGSGIGLSMARRIVERHGGTIWVEANEGAGAHFRFTLARSEHEPGG